MALRSAQIEFSANVAKLNTGIQEANRSIKHFESSFKTSFANIAGAIYSVQSAWYAMQGAFGKIEGMASVIEAEGIIDSLGKSVGKNSQTIVADILAVSEGMLSIKVATETASQAMAKGLDPSALTGLAAASVTLSDAMGVTANEAFQKLAEGITANKEKSIKLGTGVIDLKDKYGDLAAEMTETEKQQALLIEVMEKAQNVTGKLGENISTLSDDIERMKSRGSDLAIIFGAGLYTAIASVGAVLAMAGAGFHSLNAAIWQTVDVLTLGAFPALKAMKEVSLEARDAALKMAEKMMGGASDGFSVMTRKIEQMGQAMTGGKDKMSAMAESSKIAQQKLADSLSGKKGKGAEEEIKKIADAMENWQQKIEGLNPAIKDNDQAIQKLIDDYVDLQDKLKDNTKEIQKAQELLLRGIGYLEAKEAVKQYREEVQITIDATQDQISDLDGLRKAYEDVYSNAITQANKFYDVASKADSALSKGRDFLSGFKTDTRTPFQKLVEDKEKITKLFSEGFRSDNVEQVEKSLAGIGSFIDTYKDQKNILGSGLSDWEDAKQMYEDLLGRLESIRDQNRAFGDSWIETANQAATAINQIDDWIYNLQDHIESLKVILNTDQAIQAAEYLKAQIDRIPEVTQKYIVINTVYAGGGSVESTVPAPAGEGYATGTNYVPHTGMYQLHQGEAVIPKNQNKSGGAVGNFSPTFNISGDNPKVIAKEVYKIIKDYQEYGRVN